MEPDFVEKITAADEDNEIVQILKLNDSFTKRSHLGTEIFSHSTIIPSTTSHDLSTIDSYNLKNSRQEKHDGLLGKNIKESCTSPYFFSNILEDLCGLSDSPINTSPVSNSLNIQDNSPEIKLISDTSMSRKRCRENSMDMNKNNIGSSVLFTHVPYQQRFQSHSTSTSLAPPPSPPHQQSSDTVSVPRRSPLTRSMRLHRELQQTHGERDQNMTRAQLIQTREHLRNATNEQVSSHIDTRCRYRPLQWDLSSPPFACISGDELTPSLPSCDESRARSDYLPSSYEEMGQRHVHEDNSMIQGTPSSLSPRIETSHTAMPESGTSEYRRKRVGDGDTDREREAMEGESERAMQNPCKTLVYTRGEEMVRKQETLHSKLQLENSADVPRKDHSLQLSRVEKPGTLGVKTAEKRRNDFSKPCSCRRTRCLKMYCDCFSSRTYCQDCFCSDCANTPQYEDLREQAVRTIRGRNPNAFREYVSVNADLLQTQLNDTPSQSMMHSQSVPLPHTRPDQLLSPLSKSNNLPVTPISTPIQSHPSSLSHTPSSTCPEQTGCSCRKTACLKKYCSCFNANIECRQGCFCVGCKNTSEIHMKQSINTVQWRHK